MDPRLLAARQAAHRELELLELEQEPLGPGVNVNAPALPRDGVALGRQRSPEALRGIDAAALLGEAHHAQAVGALDLAGVGWERAREHVEQRRLAAAVGADQSHSRARGEDEGEPFEEGSPGDGVAHVLQLDQPLGFALRGREVDLRRARAAPVDQIGELAHQGAGLVDARPRLRRARLRSAPQPFDLAPHAVLEGLLMLGLGVQELTLGFQEAAVAAVDPERAVRVDAIQLDHGGRDVLEKVAVVTDHHAREARLLQHAFEPVDAGEVEMVGGLVQQDDVRRLQQRLDDGEPLLPAAGQGRRVRIELFEARTAHDRTGNGALLRFRHGTTS